MKRSFSHLAVTIGLLSVSAFALSACEDEKTTDVTIFSSKEQCVANSGMSAEGCEKSALAAEAEHKQSAPRYDAQKVCEDQHGAGQCAVEKAPDGSSIFMPMMMGFMLGNMMNNLGNRASPALSGSTASTASNDEKERRGSSGYVATGNAAAVSSRPLYSTKTGQLAPASGGMTFQRGQVKATVPERSFNSKAPTTIGKPAMSAATVKSTGGFGARSGVGGRGGSGS